MNKIARTTLLAGLLAIACSDPTGTVRTEDLSFLRWSPTAPLLEDYRLEFFGVAGEERQWQINYVGGERFLRFRLDAETLVRDSAGVPLQPGDSVRITVTVDSTLFIVRFLPEGLIFNPNRPADLEFEYDHADAVFLQQELSIRPWRQERAGDPWRAVPPVRWELDLDEIEIDVFGFTRYALAVN